MFEASFPLCVGCNKEVNFHHHALCCDKCCRWQHRLCDSGITYKDYRCLAQGEIEIAWQCSDCSAESIETQSSHILTKDNHRRSKRGVKLRKDQDFLYDKESLNPLLNRSNGGVELTDLPSGWEEKPIRKFAGPNKKQGMIYMSPNGRIFHSKQQALEFCKLHYQEVTYETLEYLDDTPSSITKDPDENKKDSKITSTELIDKSLQPFIRLHKLNNNSENIRIYQPFVQLQRLSPFKKLRETREAKLDVQLSVNQPFVQLQRLSPFKKLRETREAKPDVQLSVNSDSINTELAVKDTVIQRDKANKNLTKIPVKDDNNNKMSTIKKKQTKLHKVEVKRHIKNNIKRLKIKETKSPMKVKAQMKKDYLKINIKIDRKSLQIHPNHNIWIDKDQNPSERRWNLKLGSVKIKDKGIFEKNDILENMELYNDGSENEIAVGKKFSKSHMMKPLAENAKLHTSHGSRLIWLHISPEDLEFGLIS